MKPAKSIKKAYLYWLILGILGLHRFYLGKKTSATILLISTIIWAVSYLLSTEKAFGILAVADYLSPVQDWLISWGSVGKWLSAMLFLPFLLFPLIWWFTDLFRIPRLFGKDDHSEDLASN